MTHRNQKQSNSDTVVIGKKPFEELWQSVFDANPRDRPKGEGWMCVREIMDAKKWTLSTASNWAQRNHQFGMLEKASGTRNGRRVVYYRPIKK